MIKKHHITEKPVRLMEIFIESSSKENDIVLDCFMGSGTTGIAAKRNNRKFIGIEIDKKYFDIAKKRIKEYQGILI
jgi:site-specific DNA-methyltransferase (adenine-specific)